MTIQPFKMLVFAIIVFIIIVIFAIYSALLTKHIWEYDKSEAESERFKISECKSC